MRSPAVGERLAAQDAYRRALRLRPDAEVERKIATLAAALAAAPAPNSRAQFRLRYDGGINEPMGTAVLEVLAGAYDNYAARLHFRPDDPITVVLEMGNSFQDTGAPEWAAGFNDGVIHVPLRGMERLSVPLVAVLRHELAHSFIRARTGGNCPTWLQEGIAQWLEGGNPSREDAVVAAAARQRPPLAAADAGGPVPVAAARPGRPGLRGEPLRHQPHRAHARGIGDRAAPGRRSATACPRKKRCPSPSPSAIRSSRRAGRTPSRPQRRAPDFFRLPRYQSSVRRSPVSKSTFGR